MDIMPISMQSIIPRTGEASQVQHNLNQQMNVAQDFQALQGKEDARQKEQQVQARENAEDGRIKEEPDREGKGTSYQGRRRQSQDETDEISEETHDERYARDHLRGNYLDIST